MSIKLITCSSELCSAHGNKTICFRVFSEESRTWQSYLQDQKLKKKKEGQSQPSEPYPQKAKQKKSSPANKREARSWFHDFYHGSNAGSIPDIPTSSGWLLSSWLIYLPAGCERSLRIINVFINLLSIVARCTGCRGLRERTRSDPWLPGCCDASYLQLSCCFYKFNLGIKELIVEPCRYNIFNPAVHHINRYRRGQAPIIPGSSTYL